MEENGQVTDTEAKRELFRLTFARWDLKLAKTLCSWLLGPDHPTGSDIHTALWTAMVVCYWRPFSNNNIGRLNTRGELSGAKNRWREAVCLVDEVYQRVDAVGVALAHGGRNVLVGVAVRYSAQAPSCTVGLVRKPKTSSTTSKRPASEPTASTVPAK